MALMNLKVVDVISIDLMGNAVLTICDDLIWNDNTDHLITLQKKINSYLEFIESGNLYQEYPNAKGKKIIVNVAAKYEPNESAKYFLNKTKEILQSAGYEFEFIVVKD